MTRSIVEEADRIALQSTTETVPEPAALARIGTGESLSISAAARQLSTQRKTDIVWGAEAIAPYLGRTTKGAFGALETGQVPGAKKIAGRWALNLRIFYATFGEIT